MTSYNSKIGQSNNFLSFSKVSLKLSVSFPPNQSMSNGLLGIYPR